jgi:hypothetical protein
MGSFMIDMVFSGFSRETRKNKELDADLRIQMVCSTENTRGEVS